MTLLFKEQLDQILAETNDAWSFDKFGADQWSRIAGWLLINHSQQEVVAILMSKHPRWCLDEIKVGLEPQALDFVNYFNRRRQCFTKHALEQLVRENSNR